jgi:hypothetical protein
MASAKNLAVDLKLGGHSNNHILEVLRQVFNNKVFNPRVCFIDLMID